MNGFTQTRIILIGLTATLLVGGGIWLFVRNDGEQVNSAEISSYEACVAAGNPILESYPEQCVTPDGETFVRQLTDAEQKRLEEGRAQSDDAAQAEAIREAQAYRPDGFCTQALVDAVHTETGAEYTFPSGCLAPGWEPR